MNEGPNFHGRRRLRQFHEFGLGLTENGKIRVGSFPESKKVRVGHLGFICFMGHGMGSSELDPRQRSDEFVFHQSRMVEDLLELGGGSGALFGRQVGLAPKIDRVKREGYVLRGLSGFIRQRSGKRVDSVRLRGSPGPSYIALPCLQEIACRDRR
jgi:hypothetical protein